MSFKRRFRPGKSKKCWCGSGLKQKNCHGVGKPRNPVHAGKSPATQPKFQESVHSTKLPQWGVSGEEHKLWVVPLRKGEIPPATLVGTPGKYKIQLLLSRPGFPIISENEHAFIDSVIGNSHLLIAKPSSARGPNDVDQVMLEAHTPTGQVTFSGLPNENGYLGKLVVGELLAENFQDAETRAYEAVAPFLSAWSLHLDIPIHVETMQVTNVNTQTSSLRVRTPHLEMTFAGGLSPNLSPDFCQYASIYREGMNTNSPFYRFLCFYKIIESLPLHRARLNAEAVQQGRGVRRVKETMPGTRGDLVLLLHDLYPWRKTWDDFALDQILPNEVAGKKIGWIRENYLQPIRVGIAHALLRTGEVRVTLDNLEDIQKVNRWLPMCRVIARMMLKNEFPREFALTMEPLLAMVESKP